MDFESDDRLVTFAGYVVATHRIDQIGPCPSLLNNLRTAAKFTILHTNEPERKTRFHEAGVVKLLTLLHASTAIHHVPH